MNKAIQTALKLQELANRGEGGEKTAAQAMFKKHMARHNLTEADLQAHAPVQQTITVEEKAKGLAVQIIYTITGQFINATDGHTLTFEATEAQAITIQQMVDFYWPLLKEEYQTLFMAFATVNRLFPNPAIVKAKTVPTQPEADSTTPQPEANNTLPPPPPKPKTAEEQYRQQQKERYYLQLIQPTPFYPPLP